MMNTSITIGKRHANWKSVWNESPRISVLRKLDYEKCVKIFIPELSRSILLGQE